VISGEYSSVKLEEEDVERAKKNVDPEFVHFLTIHP